MATWSSDTVYVTLGEATLPDTYVSKCLYVETYIVGTHKCLQPS